LRGLICALWSLEGYKRGMMKSTMNPKYKSGQLVFHTSLLAFSMLFWMAAKSTDSPVMPIEVYGDAVRLFAAETWAGGQMIASFAVLFGVLRNGRAWWSPYLRLIGNISACSIYGYFCYSAASSASFPEAVTLAAITVFSGQSLFYAFISFMDCVHSGDRNGN